MLTLRSHICPPGPSLSYFPSCKGNAEEYIPRANRRDIPTPVHIIHFIRKVSLNIKINFFIKKFFIGRLKHKY